MMRRDVQLSMIDGAERAVGSIPGSVMFGTNADLIAALAPLYLAGGTVLDVTYGEGSWWRRWRPEDLAAHDLRTTGVDFRHLPFADRSFTTVCFDPPYVPRQGSDAREGTNEARFRSRYGLDVSRSHAELRTLIREGVAEAARVADRWVLAKCCDYTNGRALHLGHELMMSAGRACGLSVHDLIVHASGSGPGGTRIFTVKRTRRTHSYLVVFRRRASRHATKE